MKGRPQKNWSETVLRKNTKVMKLLIFRQQRQNLVPQSCHPVVFFKLLGLEPQNQFVLPQLEIVNLETTAHHVHLIIFCKEIRRKEIKFGLR